MLTLVGAAVAQKNEIAVAVGGHFPVDTSSGLSVGHALALQGNFAHRIASVPLVSLYFEVPVIGGFNIGTGASVVLDPNAISKYSSLFITPGLKLKFAPSFPVSPYLVAGGGLARFKGTATTVGGTTNTNQTVNKGAFDIGGGLDWKAAPFLSIRTEVRDVYSGLPSLTSSPLGVLGITSARQHNLLPALGLVLRF